MTYGGGDEVGMKTQEDFPYARRPGLALIDDNEGYAEAVLGTLNWLLEQAEKEGVSIRLRFRDAGTEDRSGDRLEAIEWVTASGEEYFIEELDVVNITAAAELVGMSRSALAARVSRAHRAEKPTPFQWSEWSGCWLAKAEDVKAWVASWKGVHAKRGIRAASA
jgi:hypothetical protein